MDRDSRRTRMLLALLVVTSISLIVVDHTAGSASPLAGLRYVAASVFGPLERVAASVAGPVGAAVHNVGSLHDSRAEAARLAARNQRLLHRLRTSELDHNRATELDSLLHLAGAGRYRIVPARVIAVGSAQSFSWTVTIDAGRRDGLRPDLTVLNGDGLVGRVTTVGATTATVLLAIDPDSSVGARLEHTMEIGFTTGQGAGNGLDLQLLDSQSSVAKGDRLVTFGSQGSAPYVPGVPVGRVRSVQGTPGSQTRSAQVVPYVDFTSLDLVGVVVQPPKRDPRDAVLPPVPTATPTPTVTVTVTAPPAPASSTTAGR